MSIKKQLIWNDTNIKFDGYCDFGNDLILEGRQTEAIEVSVFMLISLNGKCKFKIAYFFQNKINTQI